MAHVLRETRTAHPQVVDEEREVVGSTSYGVANIISLIGGIIVALLGIRFLLMLFGANNTSGFVNFIYSITQPLAAPFFGIFNYQEQFGVARFEFETLIAMAVYGLITWALVRLAMAFNR